MTDPSDRSGLVRRGSFGDTGTCGLLAPTPT